MENTKFKVGDKAVKVKGYKFPCTIVSVFQTVEGNVRVVGEMDDYGSVSYTHLTLPTKRIV